MKPGRASNGTFLPVKKTHCVRGHGFTPENTRIKSDGSQVCRKCVQVRKKRLKKTPFSRDEMIAMWRKHKQEQLPMSLAAGRRAHDKRAVSERQEAINEIKRRPCADCGGTFHPCAMDFDHVDPTTKIASVSELVAKRKSMTVILEEIAKCEIVCANCHRVRTFNRGYSDEQQEDEDDDSAHRRYLKLCGKPCNGC